MGLLREALIASLLCLATAGGTAGARCTGDRNDDGRVTIDELLAGVQQVLTGSSATGDELGIDDLIAAVDKALKGCPGFTCRAGTLVEIPERLPDPEVVETATGTNGSFTDVCGRQDHLIEWRCEDRAHCVRDPINLRCTRYQTGAVVPRLLDCPDCIGGTCRARCPSFSDTLRYLQINGDDVVFENENDRRRYQCALFDDPRYPGCQRTPSAGDREQVTGLGLNGLYCTHGNIGNVGLSNGCSYLDCVILSAVEATSP